MEKKTRHGMSKTPEYRTWVAMLARVKDLSEKTRRLYFDRGIRVCARWASFEKFFSDMGPKPSPRHTLDRFPDNNGNYEPGNCRWATWSQQNKNRRPWKIKR